MKHILADESLKILVFFGLPLTLLLIGFLVFVATRPNFNRATFPGFSVEVFNLYRDNWGSESGYIEFREGKRRVKFPAQFPLKAPVRVQVPDGISEEDLTTLVPKVSKGLKKMRRKYVIYKKLEPLPVPQEDRDAAKAQLDQMGVETVTSGEIQSPAIHNWKRLGGKEALEKLARVQALMRTAEGFQENIQILTRSD